MEIPLISMNSDFVGSSWTAPALTEPPQRYAAAQLLTQAWDDVSRKYPQWHADVLPLPAPWTIRDHGTPQQRLSYLPAGAASAICLAAGLATSDIEQWLHPSRYAPDHATALLTEAHELLFNGTGWVSQQQLRSLVLNPSPADVSAFNNPLTVAMAHWWVARTWPFGSRNPAAHSAFRDPLTIWHTVVTTDPHAANPTTRTFNVDPRVTFEQFREEANAVLPGPPIRDLVLTPTVDPAAGVITGCDRLVTDVERQQRAYAGNAVELLPLTAAMNRHLNVGWSIIGLPDTITADPVAVFRFTGRIPITDPHLIDRDRMLSALTAAHAVADSIWPSGTTGTGLLPPPVFPAGE